MIDNIRLRIRNYDKKYINLLTLHKIWVFHKVTNAISFDACRRMVFNRKSRYFR